MEIPIEQADRLFANLSKAFEQNMPKVLMNMANVGSAEVQARVFNQGKSADNVVMRYKSAEYKKKRQKFGRQTGHKDLIFTGDMANSLNLLVRSPLMVDYAFVNARSAQIAEWQETSEVQVNKPIFKLNTKEIAIVEKAGIKDVARISRAVIESFPNMPTFTPMNDNKRKRTISTRPSAVARKRRTSSAKNKATRKKVRKF